MSALSDLSRELANITAEAGRSVVRVEARRRIPASGIIWSADGTVVTASHVVEREEEVHVGLPDGSVVPATLAGRDPSTDLAVLRLQGGSNLTAATRAGTDGVQVGHLVMALGRPGRTVRATLGIVSALGDAWRTAGGTEVDHYLQADVGFFLGISGGPLVDTTGRVLGLHTVGLHRRTGVTIPTATVDLVSATLLAHGRMRRGYLGIEPRPVRLTPEMAQAAGQRTGLLFLSVEPDSPAQRGGLLVGDILLSVDGRPVPTPRDLMAMLVGEQIGRTLSLRLIRGGQVREATVTLGERD
ncbi:MAG: serine protease [Armatimonadetes bacterium]|nr:serine protease [Armatimonadota bacterium]